MTTSKLKIILIPETPKEFGDGKYTKIVYDLNENKIGIVQEKEAMIEIQGIKYKESLVENIHTYLKEVDRLLSNKPIAVIAWLPRYDPISNSFTACFQDN